MTSPDRKARGRTRAGRLSALDRFLLHREHALWARATDETWAKAPFVDVGFGEHAWTTLESAATFRTVHPRLEVLGVEREPHRVDAALRERPADDADTRFVQGGFDRVASLSPESRLIRVMNVLRGYPEPEVSAAHRALSHALLPGGLLVEGSSDPDGSILTCHLLRKETSGALKDDGLLFYCDVERGFAPRRFRDWLPRLFRRRAGVETPVGRFLARWTEAWEAVRATEHGAARPSAARTFERAAEALAHGGEQVEADPWQWANGFLVWTGAGVCYAAEHP